MNGLGRSAIVGILVLMSMAATDGCARRKQGTATAKANPTPPRLKEAEVKRYRDPAAIADLRDRATAMLEKFASDASPQIRANAIEALSESPARLEPLVSKALVDVNPGVRSTGAMMVGRLKLVSAAPLVRSLLNDTSPYVKASAIYALSRCGQKVDPTPMAQMLLHDPSSRVRAHAAYLIGELGEPSAAGMLREASMAKVPRATPTEIRLMQLQIAEALVKLGDDGQLEVIRAALYPSRPEDLEAAALAVQIIGQVRDRGAVDQLIYLTAYQDSKEGQMPAEVRLGAAGSLARLGNDRGTFIADTYLTSPLPAIRAQTAYVYGQIGRTENLPRLEKLLEDPSEITRVSAAAGVLKVSSTLAQFPETR